MKERTKKSFLYIPILELFEDYLKWININYPK
jgi:hypothetical protein